MENKNAKISNKIINNSIEVLTKSLEMTNKAFQEYKEKALKLKKEESNK